MLVVMEKACSLLDWCIYSEIFHYGKRRLFFFFFFQAEDGIRDRNVTGVQTCLFRSSLFGRQSGIILLMLFAGLKILETRTYRDAAVCAFLGYFLIITNFLYTQSIPTGALMGVALFVLTASLVALSAPQRSARANLKSAALLLAHAAPAALALFLLFPRVQGPL